MSIKRKTNGTGPSVAILSGQLGQVSSGMAKRSLAMEIPEYDLPTSAGVYKQLYAYGNYIDEVVYASCPGATYTMRRYLHDHLYSPAAIVYLTASNCILVERSEYDAYGAAHYYNADYSQTFAVSQHGNPFAFTGREIDSFDFASGVPQLTKMHYRHRDYSPFMGRFYQQDPKSIQPMIDNTIDYFDPKKQYSDDLSLYIYASVNPILMIDPEGLAPGYVKPGCGTCGPDITDALIQVVEKIKNDFNSWPKKKQKKKCSYVFDVTKFEFWDAWDILELNNPSLLSKLPGGNTCPAGDQSCNETVTVGKNCYKSHSVNYIMFGVMGKLCDYQFAFLHNNSMLWKWRKYRKTKNPWDYPGTDTEWYGWMWIGWVDIKGLIELNEIAVKNSIHTHCKPCTNCFAQQLHYIWEPIYPGDENPDNVLPDPNPR